MPSFVNIFSSPYARSRAARRSRRAVLDSLLLVSGESEERELGVESTEGGCGSFVEPGKDIPRGPGGILGRFEDGKCGAGCAVSGVIEPGVLSVDADGVARLPGRIRGFVNGGGKRSSL